ncbi:MAG TPA: c-type cytochrome [Actinomycetota bacterium]|nr:c-type cytochrome [Actinomycetota bacterium]
MTPQRIAILAVAGTLGVLVLLLLVYGRPRRARQEPLPANFSRGDPDSVLEGPRLHRMLVWGVASMIFCAGFLAVYLAVEPFREASYAKKFLAASVERGRVEYKPATDEGESGANCASCHGPDGSGGFASTNPEWPAPPLNSVYGRLTRDQVQSIVERGRPGTPMPAWSVRFGGGLNDQKIDDVLNYIEKIQLKKLDRTKFEMAREERDGAKVFASKCAVCHGPDATGRAMGRPIPTFYAPDLTTEFYRLGIHVMRDRVARRLRIEMDLDPGDPDPEPAVVEAALARTPAAEILKAGEEASRETVNNGRPNTPMPAWKNRLHVENIDAVMAYLRSIQKSGAAAGGGGR